MPDSLPPTYFDDVYAAKADPWDFETSPYETAKYDDTLAALGERRYARGFEIGCSIGVLTLRLAARCEALLSVDVSDTALAAARARCAAARSRPGASIGAVEFRRMQVPDEFPSGRFDLVVMSEVAYYWSPPDLGRALRATLDALAPGGTLLMVHWTPEVHDYPQTGDAVHAAALALASPDGALVHRDGWRRERYRLDRFERAAAPIVD